MECYKRKKNIINLLTQTRYFIKDLKEYLIQISPVLRYLQYYSSIVYNGAKYCIHLKYFQPNNSTKQNFYLWNIYNEMSFLQKYLLYFSKIQGLFIINAGLVWNQNRHECPNGLAYRHKYNTCYFQRNYRED